MKISESDKNMILMGLWEAYQSFSARANWADDQANQGNAPEWNRLSAEQDRKRADDFFRLYNRNNKEMQANC